MALVKCKECGEKISTKAESCPSCGAKPPKKTSMVTWLVLVLVIFVVYSAIQSPSTSRSKDDDVSEKNKSPSKSQVSKSAWNTSSSKDEMSGKISHFASTTAVAPVQAMNFPYHDVKAWLGVGCDGESEWAYVGFNKAPNLSDTKTKDGYNEIVTNIKWNESVEIINLTQKWSASFLHFSNGKLVIPKIMNSSKVLLELQWHGEKPAYFSFPLNGSTNAIAAIRNKCKN